jgi:putative ubiquitin-RnfH superfamily antitoxin RatB of RatAB toxin-antitoxin module
MGINKHILIEIVYVTPLQQHLVTCHLPEGSTIEQAILVSNILSDCPEIDLKINKVGIFNKRKELQAIVREGDRVEIYRPLIIDPNTARLKRALKNKKS